MAFFKKPDQILIWTEKLKYTHYLLKRRPTAMIGLVFIGFLILVALTAPLIAPYSPNEFSASGLETPSLSHPFGVDHLGRDQLSRVIYGTRISSACGPFEATRSPTLKLFTLDPTSNISPTFEYPRGIGSPSF